MSIILSIPEVQYLTNSKTKVLPDIFIENFHGFYSLWIAGLNSIK